jgi:uncharacterized membrane-anchored protein YhcB (DUF1043 family)
MSKNSKPKTIPKSFSKRLKSVIKTQRKLEKRVKFLETNRKEFMKDFIKYQLMTLSLTQDFSDFKYYNHSAKKTNLEENKLIN